MNHIIDKINRTSQNKVIYQYILHDRNKDGVLKDNSPWNFTQTITLGREHGLVKWICIRNFILNWVVFIIIILQNTSFLQINYLIN